jgi:DNA modification methylase
MNKLLLNLEKQIDQTEELVRRMRDDLSDTVKELSPDVNFRRAIELWSNPDDVVLDPFDGIGSVGYVALEEGRRHLGVELKDSYYKQAVANCKAVIERPEQLTLEEMAK